MKIDITIIKQLQLQIEKSNQKAFENLYRFFYPRLYNFCMLYLHKKEAAEEIVNDVMVKIWVKREFICSIENLETYLFVAIRNLSLNYLQKYSHLHITSDPESALAKIINFNNPEKDLEWKEISFKLNIAIEQMPEQQRTVFKLIKEEGFKYKQVAEILGISPRTVETQLYRAIKKLGAIVNVFVYKPMLKQKSHRPLISILLLIFFFI